jgi:hypothetical protein
VCQTLERVEGQQGQIVCNSGRYERGRDYRGKTIVGQQRQIVILKEWSRAIGQLEGQ